MKKISKQVRRDSEEIAKANGYNTPPAYTIAARLAGRRESKCSTAWGIVQDARRAS